MSLEKIVRQRGRKLFIVFRNTQAGIVAYLPDGVSKCSFETWEEAEEYLNEIS